MNTLSPPLSETGGAVEPPEAYGDDTILRSSSKLKSVSVWLLLALVFGITYTQRPLYTSDQNTKFFYGLAEAGVGYLRQDWLASTVDPLPVFSFLVSLTHRYLHEYILHFHYALLLGVYLYSLLGIASKVYSVNRSRLLYYTLLVILIAFHSHAFDYVSSKLLGTNLGLVLQSGIDGKNMLGRIFRPSTFGVLIVLSIYVFLCRKPLTAALLLGIAAVLHPAYLLTSAIFTVIYMAMTFREEGNLVKPLLIGAIAFVLVLPVLIYYYVHFSPTSPETWKRAQEVLANFRMVNRTNLRMWLNDMVYIKLCLIVISLYLAKNTRLYPIMLWAFVSLVALTVAQVLVGNDATAVSIPWRVSVILVPLACSVIIAYGASVLFEKFAAHRQERQRLIALSNITVVILLVSFGIIAQVKQYTKYYRGDSIAMMDFVKETKSSGETYLIPIDLEDFRLYTGAPTFVTFKTSPLKDVEFLEWYRRINRASHFYGADSQAACGVLKDMVATYNVTHLIVRMSQPRLRCSNLSELYRDEKYLVYRVSW